MYITAAHSLPNHKFYRQFVDVDDDQVVANIHNVMGFVAWEFVSFVMVGVVMRRKLHFSTFHKVAFVLESQWHLIQVKIIVWVLFTVQLPLQHFGEWQDDTWVCLLATHFCVCFES